MIVCLGPESQCDLRVSAMATDDDSDRSLSALTLYNDTEPELHFTLKALSVRKPRFGGSYDNLPCKLSATATVTS